MNKRSAPVGSSATRLLIMRHGAAEALVDADASRSLTAAGKAEVQLVARALVPAGFSSVAVCHSPYARARETAAMVQRHLGSSTCLEYDDLTPDSNPRRAAELVQSSATDLLCVAHQPLVGRMVSWLVDGDARAGSVFATAAVALLRCDFPGPAGATLIWYREPHEWL
jgi:phosphohistidine phosphatase